MLHIHVLFVVLCGLFEEYVDWFLFVVCSYYILFEYYLVEVVVYIGFVDKLAEVDNVSAGVVDVIVIAVHVHVV